MLKSARALLVVAAFALAAAPLGASAAAPDPVLGTWKLNVAQSKWNPGPAPKSQTRTYKATAGMVSLSFTSVGADGKETTGASAFSYDGKDYPISGSADFDTLALKVVNDHEVQSTQKKAGKAVGSTTRTVSADGKTLTLHSTGTSVAGKAFDNTLVFDKQ
jgi:hypothetical protein